MPQQGRTHRRLGFTQGGCMGDFFLVPGARIARRVHIAARDSVYLARVFSTRLSVLTKYGIH